MQLHSHTYILIKVKKWYWCLFDESTHTPDFSNYLFTYHQTTLYNFGVTRPFFFSFFLSLSCTLSIICFYHFHANPNWIASLKVIEVNIQPDTIEWEFRLTFWASKLYSKYFCLVKRMSFIDNQMARQQQQKWIPEKSNEHYKFIDSFRMESFKAICYKWD